jgi:hypothetical protein
MEAQPLAIVRFAPRNTHSYLDCGVYDIFRDVPEAVKAAARFEALGFYALGHLVQLSEHQIRTCIFMNEKTLDAMKAHLARIGFGFDMCIPWWSRRHGQLPGLKP